MKKVDLIVFLPLLIVALNGCKNNQVTSIENKINAIGTVSIESQKIIEEIEQEYSVLSDKDKETVANYSILSSAREELNDIILEEKRLEEERIAQEKEQALLEKEIEEAKVDIEQYAKEGQYIKVKNMVEKYHIQEECSEYVDMSLFINAQKYMEMGNLESAKEYLLLIKDSKYDDDKKMYMAAMEENEGFLEGYYWCDSIYRKNKENDGSGIIKFGEMKDISDHEKENIDSGVWDLEFIKCIDKDGNIIYKVGDDVVTIDNENVTWMSEGQYFNCYSGMKNVFSSLKRELYNEDEILVGVIYYSWVKDFSRKEYNSTLQNLSDKINEALVE